MDDLQIAPREDKSSTAAILISFLVLAIAAAAIFYFNPHKVADLKVSSVDSFAPHTTFDSLGSPNATPGMHVLDEPTSSAEDDLYVFARVSLTDHLRLPLFITGATAHVTLADGSEEDLTMLTKGDLSRLEVLFPDIRQHVADPIGDGDQIDPRQTRTGTIAFQLPGRTVDAWKAKKSATLTVELRNQEPQTTTLP